MALSDDLAQVKLRLDDLVNKLKAIVDTSGTIVDVKKLYEETKSLPSFADPILDAAMAACASETSPAPTEEKKKH